MTHINTQKSIVAYLLPDFEFSKQQTKQITLHFWNKKNKNENESFRIDEKWNFADLLL